MVPHYSLNLEPKIGEISGKFWGIGPQMVLWKKVHNYVYWNIQTDKRSKSLRDGFLSEFGITDNVGNLRIKLNFKIFFKLSFIWANKNENV